MKILLVAGARPNFVKIAPIVKVLAERQESAGRRNRLEWKLVHTGQHYDASMSQVFFDDLGIPQPNINLEVGSGSHAVQTAQIMMRFEAILNTEQPDWVVVVGDVNSTIACTLVASKMGIKVAHVEAGLRSFDRTMPEEINRLVTDALADLLFTPSADAGVNLLREGIAAEKIHLVGNIMIDTLVHHRERAKSAGLEMLSRWQLADQGFVYVTLHRPSNVDQPEIFSRIMEQLQGVAKELPVIFPVHPRTRSKIAQLKVQSNEQLYLVDPITYHESICLVMHARFVLTDSGGLQEETTFLRVPCLTLRPNTERPVTIIEGSNRLSSIEKLGSDIQNVLTGPARIGKVPEMWDGRTAERVLTILVNEAAIRSRSDKITVRSRPRL